MRVQEIQGTVQGAATMHGGLGALAGIAGFLAGITVGHLSDRVKPRVTVLVCSLLAGGMAFPHAIIDNFPTLYVVRFVMCFAMAGIEPILHAWLSRSVPEGSQGRAFGWSGSARAVGWLMAPLASGYVAWQFDVRAIFIVSGILLTALGPILYLAMRNRKEA